MCSKKVFCKSFCCSHYYAWKRHGDPLYKRSFKKDEKCIVETCERKQARKGYCKTHAMKLQRTGTLDYIRDTEEYKSKWLNARLTDVSKLDGIRDPKSRGFLATNVISDIKIKARKRQIPWDLNNIDAYKLIIGECHYCGFKANWPETRCGLDRVDNFKGYSKDNVVSCCFTCNSAKGSKTQDEFKLWVISVFNNFAN